MFQKSIFIVNTIHDFVIPQQNKTLLNIMLKFFRMLQPEVTTLKNYKIYPRNMNIRLPLFVHLNVLRMDNLCYALWYSASTYVLTYVGI